MHTADTVEHEAKQGWVTCYIATVIAMMAIQASSLGFSPLIPYMKESWGMTYTQMGTFTGLYGLVALLISLPAGLLAKRFGERSILAAGLLLATLGLLMVALAASYLQGLMARTVWLIGYRLAFISVVTAVAVTVPSRWRGNAMGLVGALTALATIIGSGFSSHMQVSVGWRLSIVGFAALTLVAAAYFVYFYRPAKPSETRTQAVQPGRSGMFSAFKIPIVWTIPLLGLANAGGFAATFFVPSVILSEFHGGPRMSSAIIAGAYSLAIVVNPLCGWLADRLDRWLVMAAMSAVMLPACLLMSSRNVYVFGAATAILVAVGHAGANQVYPTAAGLLRGRDTGPIMGIVGLGSGIFGYLGPQALGWLRDYSGGFDLGWRVVMGTTFGMVLLMLHLKRYAAAQDRARQQVNG